MAELTLYHAAPSRSAIVLWMLEEVGEPYDLHRLDLKAQENRRPDYLAVNPKGKVPALRHGDALVTETAAICLYLSDAFPGSGLSFAPGDSRRGAFLTWLFFAAGPFEAAVMDRAFKRVEEPPRAALGYGDYDSAMDVAAGAVAAGPYVQGERFTAADVVLGSQLRYGTMFKLVPERPEFTAYLARLAARPALARALAIDAPFLAG